MTIDINKYSAFLERIASDLDIPPGKYQDAVDKYGAVGRWLEDGEYPDCDGKPSIYVQGSFRLGTVTRPIRDGVEANYDIDLVCELAIRKDQVTPRDLKSMVGVRLQDNATYRKLLDPEGRRCWTLEYAEQDGIGFHLDVLPAVPDAQKPLDTAIAITDKQNDAYTWSASNPHGYGEWFDKKNSTAFQRVASEQKQNIQNQEAKAYASIDKVPDQLVRTPLQRSIQIMKRHRDLYFNHPDRVKDAPISIIITTLAAHLYSNEPDVYSALSGIVSKLHAHASLTEGRPIDSTVAQTGFIQRHKDGKWYIENPANSGENFADRWHEDDHARARAFFAWVEALHKDLVSILDETNPRLIKERLGHALGEAVVAKHCGIMIPPDPEIYTPPHTHITDPPKPWGLN